MRFSRSRCQIHKYVFMARKIRARHTHGSLLIMQITASRDIGRLCISNVHFADWIEHVAAATRYAIRTVSRARAHVSRRESLSTRSRLHAFTRSRSYQRFYDIAGITLIIFSPFFFVRRLDTANYAPPKASGRHFKWSYLRRDIEYQILGELTQHAPTIAQPFLYRKVS